MTLGGWYLPLRVFSRCRKRRAPIIQASHCGLDPLQGTLFRHSNLLSAF